jgi:hypothetical protein
MDLIPYLSAVILISTVATVLLAVISYAAFKLRDKRRPKSDPNDVPKFFHRYRGDDDDFGGEGADHRDDGEVGFEDLPEGGPAV